MFLDGASRFFGCSWKVLNSCDTQNSPALTDRAAKTPQKTLHDAKYALEYVQSCPNLRPNPGVLASAPRFLGAPRMSLNDSVARSDQVQLSKELKLLEKCYISRSE